MIFYQTEFLDKQLLLRTMTAADLDLIADYWQDNKQMHIANGVDERLYPTRESILSRLRTRLDVPPESAMYFILQWDQHSVGYLLLVDLPDLGHLQVHAHIFKEGDRGLGLATEVFRPLIQVIFRSRRIEKLIFEPSVQQIAANLVFKKLGIYPIKTYKTHPSPISREIDVNRYEVSPESLTQWDIEPDEIHEIELNL